MYRKRQCHVIKSALLVITVIISVAFCSACQPTPEQPVVIGKDQEKMLEQAAATPSNAQLVPLSEQINAPERYAADMTLADKLKITADVPVEVPNVQGMPTLEAKAADFTQQQVDGILAALLEGKKIYKVTNTETKDVISDRIINMEWMKTLDEFSSEEEQKSLDESIAELKEKYKTAPDEATVTESNGQLEQMEMLDENEAHIAYYMGVGVTTNPTGEGPFGNLLVQNNNDMTEPKLEAGGGFPLRRNAMLEYYYIADLNDIPNYGQNPPIPVDETTVIDEPEVLKMLKLTPAQAKEQVESLLEKAGIDYMKMCAMYLVDDEDLGNFDDLIRPARHRAYRICLCRMVNGIPCAYIRASSNKKGASGELDYMYDWYYETFQILIDDEGVLTLDWESPLEVTGTAVENSALLPFSSIRDIFEKRMRDTYEPQAKRLYITDMSVNVTRLSLEFERIAEQDSIENGLLVPVWNFYGTVTENSVDEGNEPYTERVGFDEPRPILSVNAIDGSTIDIEISY